MRLLNAGVFAAVLSACAAPALAQTAPGAPTAVPSIAPAASSAPVLATATAMPAADATGSAAPSAATPATPIPAAAASSSTAATTSATAAPVSRSGVIVVSLGEGSDAASRALARDVYGDPALRPPADRVDEATARVLAGGAAPEGSSQKVLDLAEMRKSAAGLPDASAKKLLVAIGAEAGAAWIVAVTVRDGKPIARWMNVDRGAWEPVEMAATIEVDASGAQRVRWPEAVPTLLRYVRPSPAPIVPTAKPTGSAPIGAVPEDRPWYKSPWTWVGVGGVAVVGLAIFLGAQAANSDSGLLRLQGRVPP